MKIDIGNDDSALIIRENGTIETLIAHDGEGNGLEGMTVEGMFVLALSAKLKVDKNFINETIDWFEEIMCKKTPEEIFGKNYKFS